MNRAWHDDDDMSARLGRAEFVLWAMAMGSTAVILASALKAMGKLIGQ